MDQVSWERFFGRSRFDSDEQLQTPLKVDIHSFWLVSLKTMNAVRWDTLRLGRRSLAPLGVQPSELARNTSASKDDGAEALQLEGKC